mmetsp:Transcript_26013/g.80068  ORF Transcript_26013/g.80068 Transcript_26013/m.80068 type:complete len:85 (+) Transcript_26013:316-570(+)
MSSLFFSCWNLRTSMRYLHVFCCSLLLLTMPLLQGLTTSTAIKHFEQFGKNELTPPPKTPWYIKFVNEMTGYDESRRTPDFAPF